MKPLSTSLVLFGLLALVQPALHARSHSVTQDAWFKQELKKSK